MRGARPAGSAARTSSTTTGAARVGTPDGKGPLVLGHEFCGEIVQAGQAGDRYGLAEGDRVSINPVPGCNALRHLPRRATRSSARTSTVLGVTMNGGFAEFVKTKIAHAYKLPDALTDEQGAFVEMLSSSVYSVQRADIELGDLAVVYGPVPVGLSMVQLLKNEGARVAVVGTRDYRLELARLRRRRSRLERRRRGLAVLRRRRRDGRSRTPTAAPSPSACSSRRPPSRRTSRRSRSPATGSTVVLMGLAGPDDAISVPLLSNLYQDKTIRFSLLYPLQWPKTIRILEHRIIDTGKIITHSATLDGIAPAIERVLNRDDSRHQDRHHPELGAPVVNTVVLCRLQSVARRRPRSRPYPPDTDASCVLAWLAFRRQRHDGLPDRQH